MAFPFQHIVIVRPEAYQKLDQSSAENYFRAQQQVLSALEKDLVEKGEEQIRNLSPYNQGHLPRESPLSSTINLPDNFQVKITSTIKTINPQYEIAYRQLMGFLEVLVQDWQEKVRKDGVRTYEGEPFVRWDYLMKFALHYISQVKLDSLSVENKIEDISVPPELEQETLESLLIPFDLARDFDIERPGTPALWYRAKKLCQETKAQTVEPLRKEIEKRSRVAPEEMPSQTQEHWEQVAAYLFGVKNISSPRKKYSKIISRLFEIPQRDKPKGSKSLPVIAAPDNYRELLDSYAEILPASLKRWKNLDGKIGELIIFHYRAENEPKVQEEFPFLPKYCLVREEEKMFLSLKAVYTHLKSLEPDYQASRLLRVHTAVPLIGS